MSPLRCRAFRSHRGIQMCRSNRRCARTCRAKTRVERHRFESGPLSSTTASNGYGDAWNRGEGEDPGGEGEAMAAVLVAGVRLTAT